LTRNLDGDIDNGDGALDGVEGLDPLTGLVAAGTRLSSRGFGDPEWSLLGRLWSGLRVKFGLWVWWLLLMLCCCWSALGDFCCFLLAGAGRAVWLAWLILLTPCWGCLLAALSFRILCGWWLKGVSGVCLHIDALLSADCDVKDGSGQGRSGFFFWKLLCSSTVSGSFRERLSWMRLLITEHFVLVYTVIASSFSQFRMRNDLFSLLFFHKFKMAACKNSFV
jgi:hypothetical protein